MHAKEKGNMGEAVVTMDLISKGFHVFTEIGDISKIDLIAEKDHKLYKIQVKTRTSSYGAIKIRLDKRGPNYVYYYKNYDVDVFAYYSLNENILIYIPFSYFEKIGKQRFSVRLTERKTKNPHIRKEIFYTDFLEFPY